MGPCCRRETLPRPPLKLYSPHIGTSSVSSLFLGDPPFLVRVLFSGGCERGCFIVCCVSFCCATGLGVSFLECGYGNGRWVKEKRGGVAEKNKNKKM